MIDHGENAMETDDLIAWVARLDRSNRRLRIGLFAVALICPAITVFGWGFLPLFIVKSVSSRAGIGLSARGDGAAVTALDKKGKSRFLMGVGKNGAPAIQLQGKDGRSMLTLFLDEDDTPVSDVDGPKSRRSRIVRGQARSDGRPPTRVHLAVSQRERRDPHRIQFRRKSDHSPVRHQRQTILHDSEPERSEGRSQVSDA